MKGRRRFLGLCLLCRILPIDNFVLRGDPTSCLMPLLDDDRLFPPDTGTRDVARRLFNSVRNLPIISPHGHTDANGSRKTSHSRPGHPAIVTRPLHLRMLYSQGIRLEDLESAVRSQDPRKVWRNFAEHYYLFRATPTRLWLDYAFQELFGMERAALRQNRRPLLRQDY